MLIHILSLIATTAMFGFLTTLVIMGARRTPPPKPEPLEPARLAVMKIGLMLTRLILDQGPDGKAVRAVSNIDPNAIADAISSVPCELIVEMTDEQLRAHIVRSCRSLLMSSPYRAAIN